MRTLLLFVSLLTFFWGIQPAWANLEQPKIEFLGQAIIASSTALQNIPVGGLSGITYDAEQQVYYAISDDRSQKGPARFYTLDITLQKGKLTNKSIKVLGQTRLQDRPQQYFPAGEIDAEGIAIAPSGNLWISSEGDANHLIPPFIRSFSRIGEPLDALEIPPAYLPQQNAKRGIRNNLGFESLSMTPDSKLLITATENALHQDDQAVTTNQGSHSRILVYDLKKLKPNAEFLYLTEPAPATKLGKASLRANGLVDLIALNKTHLLALERGFSPKTGFQVRLFDVFLKKATNLRKLKPDQPLSLGSIQVAQKQLLLNLGDLKVGLDNLEGMTLGPQLPDGRQLLILISDNNFSPLQMTQILAFAIQL